MGTRRSFLAGLAAATALPRAGWADVGNPAYLAAAQLPDESYVLHGLSDGGQSLFTLPLPARGHAAAAHPTRAAAVAFARRPGTYALVMDVADGRVLQRLTPPENRHFNGHGAFSADGSRLFTAEQRADDSVGVVGVWETEGYARIAEWPSHGIGPHELRRMADGSLIVANGGIATDPTDRTKLNIATMRASLAHLAADGALTGVAELPEGLHQNSIRHLALIPSGVAFALQWEGDETLTVPLLGLWRDGRVTLSPAPEAEGARMKGYAGSIAATERQIAITSSHGGVVQVFGIDGAFQETIARTDASGIAAMGDGFLVTDGTGALTRITDGGIAAVGVMALAWDNHLVALG
ncbi:MAG: DUF1513 domain-containing protein [Paracoccaceae bacterium]